MKKFRRVACMIVCMAMLVCLLPTSASAAATTETHRVRSSYGFLETAEASVEVQSEKGTASLYYDSIASSITIQLYLREKDDSTGDLTWKTELETATNTADLFAYRIAGSNTTIVAGNAILTVVTTLDVHEFKINDPID